MPLVAESNNWRAEVESICRQGLEEVPIPQEICGFLMRIRAFGGLACIASGQLDSNKDSRQFLFTILEILWMNDERHMGLTRPF